MAATGETILITGGSGFIGSHCILRGLQNGYNIRTTLRDLKRADEVRQSLRTGGATEEQIASLQFFSVDLLKDDGWEEAIKDCTFLLHVASPFPRGLPTNEDELVIPAREGTLRALRFAKNAGTVKRVVVTSSMAAISYGWGKETNNKLFTEEDWSVIDGSKDGGKVPAYQKSKTIAERAAWDFIEKEGGTMELAVICPVCVLGPVLSGDYATSVDLVSRLLNGEVPALPNVSFGMVDVRDVADLHYRAMTDAKAAGQRFAALADGDPYSFKDVALCLKNGLPAEDTKKVTTRGVPDFMIRAASVFDSSISLILSELSKTQRSSNAKAKTQLGWNPRSSEEAILECAKSLKACGAIKA